ncbi:MAG TPA: PfkB family carbohydrate kinase [Bdellovibrionota bacterium]|nr:PfkB family carbohydrate kinase [Bdellovibrionota bacterium]
MSKLTQGKVGRERLKELLGRIAGKRVLVIGDVGVDRYTTGSVERISPEAPVPIVLVEEEKLKLGLAANVADNVQALGGTPLLVGVIGRDRAGQDFKKLLRSCRIGATYLVTDPRRRTVLKERIVSERQQLLRVDYETQAGVGGKAQRECLAQVKRLLPRAHAVVIEDYAKGLLSGDFAARLWKTLAASGKVLACDPNAKSEPSIYRGAHVLTPNTKEAERLSGVAIHDEDSLLEAGRALLKATGARHIVITRGKDGMAIFSSGERQVQMIPTFAREVYDVSGAGDTVIATLTLALSAGATIVEAAMLGNVAAGIEVGKRGTATVSPEEIMAALDDPRLVV